MDFTVLELHLHDAQFNAPFSAGRRRAADDDVAEASAEPAASGRDLDVKAGPLAALLALAGLALVARYLRGGEAEQSTLDEVEA